MGIDHAHADQLVEQRREFGFLQFGRSLMLRHGLARADFMPHSPRMNFRSWFLGLAVASPIVAATQPFFLADPSRPAALQPAFSTSDNIDDPASWSAPQFLFDEHLEVDPIRLQFLFQGVLDQDMKGKPDGRIPWRLGLLEFALSDTK